MTGNEAPSKLLLAPIDFSPLANGVMSALGARSHEWNAWLLIEDKDGNVDLLLIAKASVEAPYDSNSPTQHWAQLKLGPKSSPSQAVLDILKLAHSGQNNALSPNIPTWRDIPGGAPERLYAQRAGAEDFQTGTAVKVKSSAGYIAYEAMR